MTVRYAINAMKSSMARATGREGGAGNGLTEGCGG